jgi:hypothetical protein
MHIPGHRHDLPFAGIVSDGMRDAVSALVAIIND